MQTVDWAKARWAQFRKDVWDDPSIGPVAGILLSGLAGLIAWLTIEYAPGAVDRAEQAASETRQIGEGVIRPFWGFLTIAIMTMATLAAGFEPIVSRRVGRWWRRAGLRWWNGLWRPFRWALLAPIALILAPARLSSFAFSLADYVLARPIAVLAGAAWRGWAKRYAHFVTLMTLAVGAAIAAKTGWLSPGVALVAIVAGLFAVFAVVRRWSWIERDRDTFLIERGEREEGKGTLRIGFNEDLRDEALFALACLFFLIPLGLDLVQEITTASGAPAFSFHDNEPMPSEPWSRFVTWLGYFGAELAKTVPFVDWSEVFHVANGSPIGAQTAFGSQLAFVLRAGLDLLFLAALLQAVQIATRLQEQRSAFENNRLPILEPFSERLELARVSEQLENFQCLELRASAQQAILDFPRYDAARLQELIDGTAETKDPKVRMTAAALLQKDFEAAPDSNPDTPRFWTERAQAELDPVYRDYLVRVAAGIDPDEPARMRAAANRANLLRLISEDWRDTRIRAQATRQLGRAGLSAAERDVLMHRLTSDDEMSVRIAASVALAKAHAAEAFPAIEALIERVSIHAIVLAQALAYALAHRGDPVEEIVSRFASLLRPHAQAAARIQRAPMDREAGRTAEKLATLCETVAIKPGQNSFPNHFLMGSAENDPLSVDRERPQRRVEMTQAFALGRFAVTMEEFSAFARATGQPELQFASNQHWPVFAVNWFDAQHFCRWLQAITGDGWRLPTEAEWEYACRAGSDTAYSWGADWDPDKANSVQSQLNAPRDVGSYRPNDFGLWDMHGNVLEWCADPWHKDYRGDPPTDQAPWLHRGDFSERVLRGGSRSANPANLRSANRDWSSATDRGHDIGFRIAKTTLPSES